MSRPGPGSSMWPSVLVRTLGGSRRVKNTQRSVVSAHGTRSSQSMGFGTRNTQQPVNSPARRNVYRCGVNLRASRGGRASRPDVTVGNPSIMRTKFTPEFDLTGPTGTFRRTVLVRTLGGSRRVKNTQRSVVYRSPARRNVYRCGVNLRASRGGRASRPDVTVGNPSIMRTKFTPEFDLTGPTGTITVAGIGARKIPLRRPGSRAGRGRQHFADCRRDRDHQYHARVRGRAARGNRHLPGPGRVAGLQARPHRRHPGQAGSRRGAGPKRPRAPIDVMRPAEPGPQQEVLSVPWQFLRFCTCPRSPLYEVSTAMIPPVFPNGSSTRLWQWVFMEHCPESTPIWVLKGPE